MAVALLVRNVRNPVKSRLAQQIRTGYIVLLPEVAPETVDKNPLFKDNLPDIENLTSEKCVNTLGQFSLQFEHNVRCIESSLVASTSSEDEKPSQEVQGDVIDQILDPLEEITAPLDTTWGLVKTLHIADCSLIPFDVYLSMHDRARRARSLKYNQPNIYSKFKECDNTKITEEEQRVVAKFTTEAKLNGLDLPADQKLIFNETLRKLRVEKDNFRKRVEITRQFYKHIITDSKLVREFPQDLLNTMERAKGGKGASGAGPWVVSLEPRIYNKFMEYCPDSKLRWNTWINYRTLASPTAGVSELRNSQCIEGIRAHRRNLAKLLGYTSYCQMSMETKAAGTMDNLQEVLGVLLDKAKPLQEDEINNLQLFASEAGFKGNLQLWDVPFWARKQKKALYNWDDETIKNYFPLDKVWTGLLNHCSELFHIKFKLDDSIQTWHPDVKYYHIYEGCTPKPVAGFYFDPYARSTKLYMGEETGHVIGIRPAARVYGPVGPLVSLIFNFTPPGKDSPCLLPFPCVETLFKKFGTALQHLLCSVNYSEVSGQSNIEWDAVEVVSNVFSLWLNDPKLLKSISGHYKTGEELPISSSLEEIRQHLAGFNLCSELYNSNLDLELHSRKDFWLKIVRDLWEDHFVFELDKEDAHPCSFTSVIAGDLSAAYYTRIWSQMLATDAATAFNSTNADSKVIGQRFRDTFLAFGGSCHPNEVFRRFQGRDPSPDAYIKSLRPN